MDLYEDQFSANHDYEFATAPSKFLIIASTGRSGSHMLGHALHQTGVFGFPLEYANSANYKEWKRRLEQTDFQRVMQEIVKRRTSPNGVFSIKIHYMHLRRFGGLDGVLGLFPSAKFVFLKRRDLLQQAVSLAIAQQTGAWIHGQSTERKAAKYSFQRIDNCLRDLIIQNASWEYLLNSSRTEFIEIDFDSVKCDLPVVIKRIATFMEVPLNNIVIPTTQATKKQGGALNDAWTARFREEWESAELQDDLRRKSKSGFLSRVRAALRLG